MTKKQTAVIVAGSWGTALACVLADNGNQVNLWTHSPEQAAYMQEARENAKYHKGIKLPDSIKATASMEEAARGSSAIILAAPSSAMRTVAADLLPYVTADTLIIHATKGFEQGSLKSMAAVIGEELPIIPKERLVVLSGPSHAEEVIRKCPTTVVVASEDAAASEAAQILLMTPYFRVYTNPDLIGVEVAGALKNIIALGAGMVDGLGFGDNAKAALLTRGLAEISRLGKAMGANPRTFAGLAGIGDLVVTCTSRHSRNWRAGYALAQGRSLDDMLKDMGMVVEGVRTTQAAHILSRQYGVEMPITDELFQVMFAGKSPKAAVEDLMGRMRTDELEDSAVLER